MVKLSSELDPIAHAINIFNKIEKCIGDNEELGSKFRARARELPILLDEIGLVPVLSFCYGKATDDVWKNVFDSIDKERKFSKDEEEKKSYAIYLYSALKYIENLYSALNPKYKEKLGIEFIDVRNVVGTLSALQERGMSILVSRFLKPYLLQLKRLAEAVFKEERG